MPKSSAKKTTSNHPTYSNNKIIPSGPSGEKIYTSYCLACGKTFKGTFRELRVMKDKHKRYHIRLDKLLQ